MKALALTNSLAAGQQFRLVRYFTVTSLAAIALVALALTQFMRQQGSLLQVMQGQEAEFFKEVQTSFAKQQDEAAKRDLLTIHEAGNVNLTRLFANALWERDFSPFVAKARLVPVDHCRAIADVPDAKDPKKMVAPAEKKACFAEVGRKIAAIPGYDALNAKVFDSMKKSTVFKVKVFDLRGITVYSSERAQVGEDKAFNAGWKSAMAGKPASELTHRDKFSAFEGVVEKRDLISSYLPVLAPGGTNIVGVFEVYSDVTPFLSQIKATSAQIAQTAATNQINVAKMSDASQSRIADMSRNSMLTIGVLLLALFAALFFIVRRADKLIREQGAERERVQQHLAQSEKMASLGQMVAGVAHQLNTPIAFSHNNVSMAIEAIKNYRLPLKVAGKFSQAVRRVEGDRVLLDISNGKDKVANISDYDIDTDAPTEMLSDTLQGLDQMRELVSNLREFTRLDRAKTAQASLNKSLHTVIYIAKSVIPTHIQVVEEFGELPEIECNVSQLNQVFLNLINNAAQAITREEGGMITIATRLENGHIRVDVADNGSGIPADVLPHIWDNYFTTKKSGEGTGLGLPIAKSIVEEHGGEISVSTAEGTGTTFTVRLPVSIEQPVAA